MGSGKSSVGRLLAKEREAFFLDTDSMIESLEGKNIQKIFAENGEEYFRTLEQKTVQWLKSSVKNAIISTGGGMLLYCDDLKEVGKIIYLKVPFETILSRMDEAELKKRPLFTDPEEARKIYNKRHSSYEEKADLIIDADADIQSVLTRLRDETI